MKLIWNDCYGGKIRVSAQYCQRGGNATNTLVVLSQLGHHCFWAGTRADDINASVITKDLDFYHINYSHSRCIKQATNPTSYIIHSCDNASRSIVQSSIMDEFQRYHWLLFIPANIQGRFFLVDILPILC